MTTTPTAADQDRLREQALAWFVRRRDAGWRGDEEAAFQAWLAADPRHAAAWQGCAMAWRTLDGMPADLAQGLRDRVAHRRPAPPTRRRLLAWSGGAAVLATAAGAGYFGWQQLQARPLELRSLATARGQQQAVQLSDGSRLRLDTATQLQVAYYRGRREVRLQEGQAVFEVRADAQRPFDVLAGPVRVRVVGTRFAVRYTPGLAGHDGVQVAVEEGRVQVAPAHGAQAGTLLTAGQRVTADAQGLPGPVAAVPAEGIAPWRGQRLAFVDVPLAQALAELERYRVTGLVVRDPAVAALRLSGTFDPLATAALRQALPRVLPVRLRERDGQTEVLARD